MATIVDRYFQRDQFRPSQWATPEIIKHFNEVFSRAETFVAHDIGDYFYGMDEREVWDLPNDFPGLVPPFKNFVIEFKRPSRLYSKAMGENPTYWLPLSWGTVFEAYTREEIENLPPPVGPVLRHMASQVAQRWPEDAEKWKWVLVATIFAEADDQHLRSDPLFFEQNREAIESLNRKIVGPTGSCICLVQPDGTPLKLRACVRMGYKASHEYAAANEMSDLLPIYYPAFFTLSLLNCRNVTTNVVRPPEKLNKARHKRGHLPLTTYRVLEIELFKRFRQAESAAGRKTDIKTALHLCRGHIKDYTQGKGLFGRLHGRYVWPQMMRGSQEEGVVVKDYNVRKDDDDKGR